MAIENIQYVFDHTRLYGRELRQVKNQFLSGYRKNNKKRQQKEVQLKLARRHCRSCKAIFGPSNELSSNAKIVVSAFSLWSKTRKRAKLFSTCFFRKQLFSKS